MRITESEWEKTATKALHRILKSKELIKETKKHNYKSIVQTVAYLNKSRKRVGEDDRPSNESHR